VYDFSAYFPQFAPSLGPVQQPRPSTVTQNHPGIKLFTIFSIQKSLNHVQLRRSHGYFQGIFPLQTILLSINFQLYCKELNTMVCVLLYVACVLKSCMKYAGILGSVSLLILEHLTSFSFIINFLLQQLAIVQCRNG